MAEFTAEVVWKRETASFTVDAFSRDHQWRFPGGISIPASSAPAFKGNPTFVNPEEAFVVGLSSCHMLTFLAIAALKKFVVDAYEDQPVGELARDGDGRLVMTRVTLRPTVTFGSSGRPTRAQLLRLHAQAHDKCFIANSVKTQVVVTPADIDSLTSDTTDT